MSKFSRGIVRKISFEIEYPDGSTNKAELTNADKIAFIAFDSYCFPARDIDLFNISDIILIKFKL